MITVSLVVPVFNEVQAIPIFYQAVRDFPAFQDYCVEIVFVDDGSTDGSEALLTELASADVWVKNVVFTRNFGKEAALFAGLEQAGGEVIIPIDVDLQDPLTVIPRLLEHWQAGAEVVLAKRVERTTDSFLKRNTAAWFYRVHNAISHPKIEENVGDFRLMSRTVVDSIIQMPERNLFMKGVLSWGGYQTAVITYQRAPRSIGESKFNGKKLWNLAIEGITSFSTAPLKLSTYMGLSIATVSFLYGLWLMVDKLVNGNAVPGYPSLMVSILFLGGVQLIAIGILGEYIGRIYIETKQRPRYLLKKPSKKQDDYKEKRN